MQLQSKRLPQIGSHIAITAKTPPQITVSMTVRRSPALPLPNLLTLNFAQHYRQPMGCTQTVGKPATAAHQCTTQLRHLAHGTSCHHVTRRNSKRGQGTAGLLRLLPDAVLHASMPLSALCCATPSHSSPTPTRLGCSQSVPTNQTCHPMCRALPHTAPLLGHTRCHATPCRATPRPCPATVALAHPAAAVGFPRLLVKHLAG